MGIEDQPMPDPNDKAPIIEKVIADLRDRLVVGIERYGTPLQPFNGRNAMVDLYQELLDATQYVRQVIEEDWAPLMMCNAGCGCRLWHSEYRSDADARDCACDGPCCWDSWEQFMQNVLSDPAQYKDYLVVLS